MSSQNPQIKKKEKKERSLDLSGMYFCLKLIFWPAYDSQNITFWSHRKRRRFPFSDGEKKHPRWQNSEYFCFSLQDISDFHQPRKT